MGRTETLGNNVEAYSDVNAPSGLTYGDFRATTTSTDTFDRAFDLTASPLASQAQQMASIASAFYGINWQHDFWYDAGFTEAAGNAQNDNYNRGGEDRDALLAETQDNAPSSLNNANMSSPTDGMPPRMQIFVWTGKEDRTLTIQPANRTPITGSAQFGLFDFDASGPLVLGTDDTDPVNDACTPLTNAVANKVVLVDRGNCTYKTKARNVQAAGGLGVLIANHTAGNVAPTMGNDTTITVAITIALLAIPVRGGRPAQGRASPRAPSRRSRTGRCPSLDGGLDSTLLAHEFGHYLHHRLHNCTSTFCRAISEGWGDFNALMLMVRDGDNYDGAYPFSIYTTQSETFSDDAAYFGIRRVPYSTNPTINALAYRHMSNGVAMPTTHPFQRQRQHQRRGPQRRRDLGRDDVRGLRGAAQGGPDVHRRPLEDGQVRGRRPPHGAQGRDAHRDPRRDPGGRARRHSPDHDGGVRPPRHGQLRGHAGARLDRLRRHRRGLHRLRPLRSPAPSRSRRPPRARRRQRPRRRRDRALIALPLANRGHRRSPIVTVTVTSATPGLAVTSAPVTVARFEPGTSQTITATVALDQGATGMLEGELKLELRAAGDCTERLEVPFKVRAQRRRSTEDLGHRRVRRGVGLGAEQRRDLGAGERPDRGARSGVARRRRLRHDGHPASSPRRSRSAPPEPFKVTFSHRYKLDLNGATGDAGVVEYSIDARRQLARRLEGARRRAQLHRHAHRRADQPARRAARVHRQ